MKRIKGQNGYALLIVLLMVVLFLGLSATFMAGSLNNAKQEQTIDTSNQSVAAAEMGVRYYSADFQREINIIKRAILKETQTRINGIVECFNAKDTKCDEQSELTASEDLVEKEMKDKYIQLVQDKVGDLEDLKGIKKKPFPSEDVHYAITGVSVQKLNVSELPETDEEKVKYLQVQLDISGESKGTIRNLKGRFTLEVPNTVLSDKSLKMEAKTKSATANFLFNETVPTKSCAQLIDDIKNGNTASGTECVMDSNKTIEWFKKNIEDYLKESDLNLKDFTIHVKDFQASFCNKKNSTDTGCNQIVLDGLKVVVSPGDPVFTSNTHLDLNGLSSANVFINGLFKVGSMNNTNKYSSPPASQTITVRELHVTGDISGDGMRYTNLIILGKKSEERSADSWMKFDREIKIGDYGKVCFDLDMIYESQWKDFGSKVKFVESQSQSAGKIIYYSEKTAPNPFILPAGTGGQTSPDLTSEQRTAKYVIKAKNYEEFINSCGGNITTRSLTEIPTPYINDSGVDIDVEY